MDTQVFNREIERYGSTITLKTVTRTLNDYGDEDRTYSSSSIKGVVNILGGDNDLVVEGRYSEGDKTFFVKGSISVNIGDVIVHSSNNYVVEEILEGELNDTTYVKEVRTRRE